MKTDATRECIMLMQADGAITLSDQAWKELAAIEKENAALREALTAIAAVCDYNEAAEHCSEHHAKVDGIVSDAINIVNAALAAGDQPTDV